MKNEVRNIELKIAKEKEIVRLMIFKYCKGHKHGRSPCANCSELLAYVENKVEKCPFKESKTYCSNCEICCYKPSMRTRIKAVMRYSGPRMFFSHPILTLDHVYQGLKHRFCKKQTTLRTGRR